MENQTETAQAVEVKPASPEFTGKPGNLMNDLAALQAEHGVQEATSVPTQEATKEQPATTTESAVAPVTVPDKFKTPDGQVDLAKVEKSTVDAEAALAKYQAKEKELRQKMNEVNRLNQAPPVQPQQIAPTTPVSPFELQVAQDLLNESAQFGQPMSQAQALAQARVLVRMNEARYSAEASLTETLKAKIEDQERRSELEAIAKYDESILSPEGIEALSRIRSEKPWINNSPKPWTEAYEYFLAEQVKKQRQAGTVLPTPTGLTAKAPPTPVGPAPRAVVQPQGPKLDQMTQDEINAHVAKMTPAEEKAFWASRGLRFK